MRVSASTCSRGIALTKFTEANHGAVRQTDWYLPTRNTRRSRTFPPSANCKIKSRRCRSARASNGLRSKLSISIGRGVTSVVPPAAGSCTGAIRTTSLRGLGHPPALDGGRSELVIWAGETEENAKAADMISIAETARSRWYYPRVRVDRAVSAGKSRGVSTASPLSRAPRKIAASSSPTLGQQFRAVACSYKFAAVGD